MFKNPDDICWWTLGHIILGMIAGVIFSWNWICGVIALALFIGWEWIEWSLRKYRIKNFDWHGVSLLDIVADCLGFIIVLFLHDIKWGGN